MRDRKLLTELGVPLSLFHMLGVEDCSGRGVNVVVVDSGVMNGHPHVGKVERGVRFDRTEEGVFEVVEDLSDTIGHGTACAAVIRAIAPECRLISVKILDRHLVSDSESLIRAIAWAVGEGRANVINLSLGTRNEAAVSPLRNACREAERHDAIVIAAATAEEGVDFPASLPNVISVTSSGNGGFYSSQRFPPMFYAPSYPRAIPGRSREENFKGPSFAAARVTGLIARMTEANDGLDLTRAMEMLYRTLRSLS